MNQGSSLTLLSLVVVVLVEQHLAQPDPLDDAFRDDTHFFALKSIVQEKNIVLLALEAIDIAELRLDNGVIVVQDLMEVVLVIVNILQLDIPRKRRLDTLLPLIDTLDTVDSEYPEMVDPLLKEFVQLGHSHLLLLPLTQDLVDLLQTSLPRIYRGHHLLDQGSLLCHLRKLVLYILQNLHWVVLSVEDLGHDLHVALRNVLLVPQLLEIGESLVDGLLLAFLIFAVVGLVSDFVCVKGDLLLSREGSWGRLALLRSFLSFLSKKVDTFCWGF